MKIKSHRAQVNSRFAQGFKAAFEEFNRANEEAITEPRYWGGGFGRTFRQNGEIVVGGFRNVVDTSALKDSQSPEIIETGKGRITWDGNGETPAADVHEGYTTESGHRIPARRWTRVAADEGNIVEEFIEGFKA